MKPVQTQKQKQYLTPRLVEHQIWHLAIGVSPGFNNTILPDFLEESKDFMDGDVK